jgi:hypothetical protein
MIKDDVRALEERLLDPSVRRSKTQLDSMLADGFLEFGSSGRIWSREEVLEDLPTRKLSGSFTIDDFEVRTLCADTVLATYTLTLDDDPAAGSLRSSIWRKIDERWQIVFHQGTRKP